LFRGKTQKKEGGEDGGKSTLPLVSRYAKKKGGGKKKKNSF